MSLKSGVRIVLDKIFDLYENIRAILGSIDTSSSSGRILHSLNRMVALVATLIPE